MSKDIVIIEDGVRKINGKFIIDKIIHEDIIGRLSPCDKLNYANYMTQKLYSTYIECDPLMPWNTAICKLHQSAENKALPVLEDSEATEIVLTVIKFGLWAVAEKDIEKAKGYVIGAVSAAYALLEKEIFSKNKKEYAQAQWIEPMTEEAIDKAIAFEKDSVNYILSI